MSVISPRNYGYVSLRDADSITVKSGNGGARAINRPSGVYLSADGARVTVRAGHDSHTFHPADLRILSLDLGKRGTLSNLSAQDFFGLFLGKR